MEENSATNLLRISYHMIHCQIIFYSNRQINSDNHLRSLLNNLSVKVTKPGSFFFSMLALFFLWPSLFFLWLALLFLFSKPSFLSLPFSAISSLPLILKERKLHLDRTLVSKSLLLVL